MANIDVAMESTSQKILNKLNSGVSSRNALKAVNFNHSSLDKVNLLNINGSGNFIGMTINTYIGYNQNVSLNENNHFILLEIIIDGQYVYNLKYFNGDNFSSSNHNLYSTLLHYNHIVGAAYKHGLYVPVLSSYSIGNLPNYSNFVVPSSNIQPIVGASNIHSSTVSIPEYIKFNKSLQVNIQHYSLKPPDNIYTKGAILYDLDM